MYDVDILESMTGQGKLQKYAVYKNKKMRIPKIKKRADGRRHILFKKEEDYIS